MAVINSQIEAGLTKLLEDINYIAFFSNDAPSTDSDVIGSKNEVFRIAVTPSISGGIATITYTMTTALACPSTTVSSSVSTSVINFTDASDFQEGDRIVFEVTGNYQKRKIAGKSTNQITLDKPLSATPANETTVRVLITQRAIIENGSPSANSGTLYQIEDFEYPKLLGVEESGSITVELETN